MISIIFFSIFTFFLLDGSKKNRDLMSPARIFILVWSFSIGLADLKFSGFQHEWSAYSWFVLSIGLTSFLLGIYMVYVFSCSKEKFSIVQLREKFQNSKLQNDRFFTATIILFFIYLVAFILEILIEGYIPIFSANIDRARIEFGVFGLHLIVNNQVVIMFLCFEMLVFFNLAIKKKVIIYFVFFITFITYFITVQRFNLFILGVAGFTITYYGTKKINIRNLLISGALLYGLLAFIQSIRVSKYATAFVYIISDMKFSIKYAIFAEPYMYIVMNLENFARLVDKADKFYYGLYTFDWLIALTGMKSKIVDYFGLVERPFINSNFNTFPFLMSYYGDFGLLGVFIFPLITGAMIALIYFYFKKNASLLLLILYSFSVAVMVISFFTNLLTMLNFAFNVATLVFMHSQIILNKRSK